ncbi:TVP38/TMEM64 family protein [Fodinicurvata halophila]|uniref:TVP38/TMEM64 family membrane protein n=1 Tax=Fodinicurvata halophila TaxID=1419723 RepID=A0ABV8UK71_9PROT
MTEKSRTYREPVLVWFYRHRGWIKKGATALLLISGLAVYFMSGLQEKLSLDFFVEHLERLQGFTAEHPLKSGVFYLVFLTLITAFNVPAVAVITVISGAVFPIWQAALFSSIGPTLGGLLPYWAARYTFRDSFSRIAGTRAQALEGAFRDNALLYMMVLRLLPVMPVWLVNIIAGLLDVRWKVYVFGTAIGGFPCTLVWVVLGDGIGKTLEQGESITPAALLEPKIVAALTTLSLLALGAALFRQFRGRLR